MQWLRSIDRPSVDAARRRGCSLKRVLCLLFALSVTATATVSGVSASGSLQLEDTATSAIDDIQISDRVRATPSPSLTLQDDATHVQVTKRATPSRPAQILPGNNMYVVGTLTAAQTDIIWEVNSLVLRASHVPAATGLPSDIEGLSQPVLSGVALASRDDLEDKDEVGSNPVSLQPRQTTGGLQIYISVTTCQQPSYNGTANQTGPPPQLTLYVSNSISTPGPAAQDAQQVAIPLVQGFANYSLTTDSPVSINVASSALTSDYSGVWQYQLAASIDGYFHRANANPFFYLIDTDTTAALLVTGNLTQAEAGSQEYMQWQNITSPPFQAFVQNVNQAAALDGLTSSYCGMAQRPAQMLIDGNTINGTSMILRGQGNKPKQQFLASSLNGSSTYTAYLAMFGNSTKAGNGVVGGGGQMWSGVQLTTKSNGNCELLYGLDFCSEVAYAVPGNPDLFPDRAALRALYDHTAGLLYANFTYSLQLIPCNTTSTAQYSLAKTCTDCANAYKQWLCAVFMPRCEDFSLDAPYSKPRNMGQPFYSNQTMLGNDILQQPFIAMSGAPSGSSAYNQSYISSLATNSSRNPLVDTSVKPGPYNELLPCEDLCYSLVQSCPAALGFYCPLPGRGLEAGYSPRAASGLSCSYLGAYYYENAGSRVTASANLCWVLLVALLYFI